jgi:dolichol-phosphate mannosyltransferase
MAGEEKIMEEALQFSVVVPVLNEEENITPLILELKQVMKDQNAREVIFVDDHSTDDTSLILEKHRKNFLWLKVIRLSQQSGQSAALHYGVKGADSPLIVTLDGDGQNDPADIQHLVDTYHLVTRQSKHCLINGFRNQRKDSGWRRFSSSLANRVRRSLLKDDTPDSGCGIKAYSKETFLDLPAFNHMHRFLPALVCQRGGRVISVAVNHRPRSSGKSHYGTLDRLFAWIVDLVGVVWLGRRAIRSGLMEEKSNG